VGGYYASTVNGLRVISINTQHLASEVLIWAENQLLEASDRNEKVLFGAHIPAGPSACYNCSCGNGYGGDCWSGDWQSAFFKLLNSHKDIVVGMVS